MWEIIKNEKKLVLFKRKQTKLQCLYFETKR